MKKWFLESLALGLVVGLSPMAGRSQTDKPAPAASQSQTSKSSAAKTNEAAQPSNSAQSSSQPMGEQLSSADKAFIQKAAEGGMAEVELGKLAQQQGSNQAVKDFGKKMVDDHGKANEQLRSVASKAGVTWPSDLSKTAKAEKDKLSKLQGAAFDKAYMNEMLKDHRADSAEFQREVNSTKNNEVKEFASNTLAVVNNHLQLAEDTAPKVGISVNKTTAQLQ